MPIGSLIFVRIVVASPKTLRTEDIFVRDFLF